MVSLLSKRLGILKKFIWRNRLSEEGGEGRSYWSEGVIPKANTRFVPFELSD